MLYKREPLGLSGVSEKQCQRTTEEMWADALCLSRFVENALCQPYPLLQHEKAEALPLPPGRAVFVELQFPQAHPLFVVQSSRGLPGRKRYILQPTVSCPLIGIESTGTTAYPACLGPGTSPHWLHSLDPEGCMSESLHETGVEKLIQECCNSLGKWNG